jgi:hypothetical protein
VRAQAIVHADAVLFVVAMNEGHDIGDGPAAGDTESHGRLFMGGGFRYARNASRASMNANP